MADGYIQDEKDSQPQTQADTKLLTAEDIYNKLGCDEIE